MNEIEKLSAAVFMIKQAGSRRQFLKDLLGLAANTTVGGMLGGGGANLARRVQQMTTGKGFQRFKPEWLEKDYLGFGRIKKVMDGSITNPPSPEVTRAVNMWHDEIGSRTAAVDKKLAEIRKAVGGLNLGEPETSEAVSRMIKDKDALYANARDQAAREKLYGKGRSTVTPEMHEALLENDRFGPTWSGGFIGSLLGLAHGARKIGWKP